MQSLIIPRDAFSHGQIRSKLWLSECFSVWARKHLNAATNPQFELNWFGSWVGIGPFLLLANSEIRFTSIKLFDLNAEHLEISHSLLDFWRCQSIDISIHQLDVNLYLPTVKPNQFFINSACEHMIGQVWLKNLPSGAFVLLQSTDMPHPEHLNCSGSLYEFECSVSPLVTVLETSQIDFNYPDKNFSRFMLFGIRK